MAKKSKTEATPAAAPVAEEEDEEEDDGNVGIFIKNLPWKVTEDDVAEFFADAGEVVTVRLGDSLFLSLAFAHYCTVNCRLCDDVCVYGSS